MKTRYWIPLAGLLVCGQASATLLIKKNGVTIYQLNEGGDLSFPAGGFYTEEASGPTPAGELRFVNAGIARQFTVPLGAAGNLRNTGRFLKNALLPTLAGGLVFRDATGGPMSYLATSGDFFLRRSTSSLPNPSLNGPFTATSVIYGSGAPQLITQYLTPTAGFTTPRRNISAFFNGIDQGTWPFSASNVPLNGMLRIPNGTGPFPVVLFAHGNHSPTQFSEPGYIYLCDLLASQGMIAGTIDVNFLNGGNFGENGARAIVHLEHVKQFKTWNAQSGHPLFGKVDINRIMIVGHSRGGEGVGHASLFNGLTSVQAQPGGPIVPLDGSNGLGPYQFNLRVVFAFAPTDGQYLPVSGPVKVTRNYFVIHGARDGDVSNFQGYTTMERAHPIDLANPTASAAGFKAMAYVFRACHNLFNSTWDFEGGSTTSEILTRPEQELVAKVYVSSLAQGMLLGKTGYLDVVKNHADGFNWLPLTTAYLSQYQDKKRLFFNHYEEDTALATLSPPASGTNSFANLAASELLFNTSFVPNGTTHGLRLSWSSTSGIYATTIDAGTLNTGTLQNLVVRMCQSSESNNPQDLTQDLTIRVKDGAGHVATFLASEGNLLPYPPTNAALQRASFPQTLRFPLSHLASLGINTADIREVSLLSNVNPTGTMYVDDFQLSY